MSVFNALFRVSVCLVPVLSGFLLAEPAAAKPGPEVYGAHPRISRLKISPEGGFVAMIGNINNQDAVTIAKIGGGHCNVGNGGNNIRDIYWGNENRVIVIATRTTKLPADYGSDELVEIGQSFTMNANCGDIRQVKGHGFLSHLSDGNILMTVQTFNNASSATKTSGARSSPSSRPTFSRLIRTPGTVASMSPATT